MNAPAALRKWGFTNARGQHDVKLFQRAYIGPDPKKPTLLKITGVFDTPTRRAIQDCNDRGGRLSRHVTLADVRCRGCGRIQISRTLLLRYERMCDALNKGRKVRITSAFRCPAHNRKVGGASRSQHLYATALDISARFTLRAMRGLGLFTGIGVNRSTGLVAHVDVRRGNAKRPAVWYYKR